MGFITKIDFSDNRQVKQFPATSTVLSGGTSFGVPFNDLVTGPDLSTSGVTETLTNVTSSFSGNSGTTNVTWFNSIMSLGNLELSALTPSNSATTQNFTQLYSAGTTTIIDGNTVTLTYTGVSFDIIASNMIDLGGGAYSGSLLTTNLVFLSAGTLDFTGRTIWVDVSGKTRTMELIVTKNPQIGYALVCVDLEGGVEFQPVSGISSSWWSASTGSNAIVVKNSDSLASAPYSLAEGFNCVASGNTSHAEGFTSKAGGVSSHAEGYKTSSNGQGSHSEGNNTIANGIGTHAEGSYTIASGLTAHAEGQNTIANGDNSHAGGKGSVANGRVSFVHGENSIASGGSTIVLGDNLTGKTSNYTYVESLNIRTIGSGAFVNDIRISADGNLTTNTSDRQLKENITPLKNALNIIKALKGVNYQWVDRKAGGDDIKFGFIAQEVEEVEPLLVFTNKNDGFKGIHTDGILPILVEAVKELAASRVISGDTFLHAETIIAEDNNIELNYGGNKDTAIGGGIKVLHALGDTPATFEISEEGKWVTNNPLKPYRIEIPFFTPINSNDKTGNEGEISMDNNYLYLKTNTGWKRSSLESF